MGIKELMLRDVTIKRYEINVMFISGMFLILLLYKVWPQFRNDAMSIDWYWYLGIFMITFMMIMYRLSKIYEKKNYKENPKSFILDFSSRI